MGLWLSLLCPSERSLFESPQGVSIPIINCGIQCLSWTAGEPSDLSLPQITVHASAPTGVLFRLRGDKFVLVNKALSFLFKAEMRLFGHMKQIFQPPPYPQLKQREIYYTISRENLSDIQAQDTKYSQIGNATGTLGTKIALSNSKAQMISLISLSSSPQCSVIL